MNELLVVCSFYWVRTTFLMKICLILMFLMNAIPTDQPTDTAYYRDARTHLKTRTVAVQRYVLMDEYDDNDDDDEDNGDDDDEAHDWYQSKDAFGCFTIRLKKRMTAMDAMVAGL